MKKLPQDAPGFVKGLDKLATNLEAEAKNINAKLNRVLNREQFQKEYDTLIKQAAVLRKKIAPYLKET